MPNAGTPRQAAPSTPSPNRGYSTPNYPTPNYPAPYKPTPSPPSGTRQPTSDTDPPPALPWQMSASAHRPAMVEASPSAGPHSTRSALPRQTGDDPPPAIPSLFHSAAL
jgi:hypothetical protein